MPRISLLWKIFFKILTACRMVFFLFIFFLILGEWECIGFGYYLIRNHFNVTFNGLTITVSAGTRNLREAWLILLLIIHNVPTAAMHCTAPLQPIKLEKCATVCTKGNSYYYSVTKRAHTIRLLPYVFKRGVIHTTFIKAFILTCNIKVLKIDTIWHDLEQRIVGNIWTPLYFQLP